MRRLNIQLHHADHDNVIPEFPAQYLRDLFRPHDVELHFPLGASLNSDPKTEQQYQTAAHALVASNQMQSGDDAHLILGNCWLGAGGGATNGYLLNPNRGVAAVFTLSNALAEGSPYRFAQVCAHEIGHMLNLIHQDASRAFPSTMDPDYQRTTNPDYIATAWQDAGGAPIGESRLLPLSADSHNHLSQGLSEPDEVYPWGKEFRDVGAEFDRSSTTLSLSLIPERQRYHQHEPFGCRIELHNAGARARRVPNELHPDTQDLRLTITRPDGLQYVHRPYGRCCQQQTRVLNSQQWTNDTFVLFDGPKGALFDLAGTYTIQAKTSVGASATTSVTVDPNEHLVCTQAFVQHLLDGAPMGNTHHHRRALNILKSRARTNASIRPLIALQLAAQYHQSRRRTAMVRYAMNTNAPQRVREDALMYAAVQSKTSKQLKRIRASAEATGLALSERGIACLDRMEH